MPDQDQYTVGWICALQTEYVAARAFLDKKHNRPETLSPNDNNHYTLGEIGGHWVVVAVLPDGEYGISSAAVVARDMLHSFPNIRLGLMVGIGGGAPAKRDIRLGDIVVSSSQSGRGGLLQYDFGKQLQGQDLYQTGFLNQPPPILLAAVSGLQAQYEENGHQLQESIEAVLDRNKRLKRKYARPALSDRLYESQYIHSDGQASCDDICDNTQLILRPERSEDEDDPAIHYGLIASGNRVIKDATFRDKLATEHDVLCFEMEAAGLMNHFPCLVIRGVCDYADSHKSNEWQGYAAMVAAAYAKDLLNEIVPHRVHAEPKASQVLGDIQNQLEHISKNVDNIHVSSSESARAITTMVQSMDLKELPVAEGAEFGTYMDQHEEECLPGTRQELLDHIQEWATSPEGKCIFWLNGLAGTGKSTISRTVAKSFKEQGFLGASFFFRRGEGSRGNATRFFPTITRQLLTKIPTIQPAIVKELKEDPGISVKSLTEQFGRLVLGPLLGLEESNLPIKTMVITIDALDECENDDDIRVILQLLPRLKEVRLVQLRIFITSRPELPIRLSFREEIKDDHQDIILHQISEPVIQYDISLFLKNKLTRIQKERSLPPDWPGRTITQTLIRMSAPLFIFAATICRILEDYQWHPEDSLSEILVHQTDASKLNATYLPVLNRLLLNQDGKKKVQLIEQYRMVLGAIILLESPLSVISLAALLGVEKRLLHVRLSFLHSILDIPHNETIPIRLFHLSLRDFLLDDSTRERTPLWINKKEMNQKILSCCLALMRQKLKQNICNLQSYGTHRSSIGNQVISDYLPPELQYSCRYWIHHLRQTKDSTGWAHDILVFLDDHFLHWVEVMSLLGLMLEARGSIRTLQSIIQSETGPVISKFLRDAERFISENEYIADVAPLQLYAAGLIFTSKTSIIGQKFRTEIPTWIYRCPRVRDTQSGHSDSVLSMIFSPDGRQLVSSSGDKTLKIWDPMTGDLKYTLKGHSDWVQLAIFSPDGQQLVSMSRDKTLKIWDPTTGDLRYTLEGHSRLILTVGFSSDGQLLASGSYDKTVKVWDPILGRLKYTLKGHSHPVLSVAFLPDGRRLASNSAYGPTRIWNLTTGDPICTLDSHARWVWSMDFSSDGQRLAFSSGDNGIEIWDLVTKNVTHTLEGHSNLVELMTFSPDSQQLASSSRDNTIKIWDATTGELKHTLHTARLVKYIKFDVNGLFLETDLGNLTIQPSSGSSTSQGGISIEPGEWVAIHGRQELSLPPSYLFGDWAVYDRVLALGWKTGEVGFLRFSKP